MTILLLVLQIPFVLLTLPLTSIQTSDEQLGSSCEPQIFHPREQWLVMNSLTARFFTLFNLKCILNGRHDEPRAPLKTYMHRENIPLKSELSQLCYAVKSKDDSKTLINLFVLPWQMPSSQILRHLKIWLEERTVSNLFTRGFLHKGKTHIGPSCVLIDHSYTFCSVDATQNY